MEQSILVVDDLEKLCKIIVRDFELIGYNGYYATNGSSALEIIKGKQIHAVLLDLKLGHEDGIEILKEIKKQKPNIPVFMITGHGTISNAVQAIKDGAYDYIQKPVNFDKLKKMVENAISLANLKEENKHLKDLLHKAGNGSFVSVNSTMQTLLGKLKKFADTDYPVFIEGESGTGKELIAEFIHSNSKRKNKELYKINCAAFSETLLDDELFGHNKGAFTGADSDFMGIFERADTSTLFLDEIGDMPLSIQAKILRTLQNHEVRRLGGKKNIIVDVRFIAATNKNIKELVENGKFREDLFFRLNTAMIIVPPLRNRRDDIPLLTRYFTKESAVHNGDREKKLDSSVSDFFQIYPWPGNIRELKNVINYAHTISTGSCINMADLPNYLLRDSTTPVIPKNQREDNERERIVEILSQCRYNKTKASELLGISRRTLYNKMEKYEIDE